MEQRLICHLIRSSFAVIMPLLIFCCGLSTTYAAKYVKSLLSSKSKRYEAANPSLAVSVKYVRQDATGSGTSWADASGDLQSMIAQAPEGGEVWVSGGTYKPTVMAGGGSSNRDKAFELKKNVKIYGGFIGAEMDIIQRNLSLSANETILSGDISADNNDSYHVVICAGEMGAATLDGFTVTGGKADGTGANLSVNGKNIPNNDGGGLIIKVTDPILFKNLTIRENSATNSGGGAVCSGSIVAFENVKVKDNQAFFAGGIYNSENSSLTLRNVIIDRNTARAVGGGLYNKNASLKMVNVKMSKNDSAGNGGTIYNENSSVTIENATIVPSLGGQVMNIENNGNLPIICKNSILFGFFMGSGNITVDYCLTVDRNDGNNVQASPSFADDDCRLQACSPGINAGDPSTTGGIDLDGQPRVQLGRVDMGAYEYIDVNGTYPIPEYIAPIVFCNSEIPPTALSLASIGNNLHWYGNINDRSPLHPAIELETKTYYVTKTNASCESSKYPISITLANTPPPVAIAPVTGSNGTVLSEIPASGDNLKWYDASTGGNLIAASTAAQTGNYYVSQTTNSCESPRTKVVVTITPESRSYVKVNGTGNGTSWDNASGDLQAMIDGNVLGVWEIWVAGGTFKPTLMAGTGSSNRDKAFVLKKDVKVYGGFAGNETDLILRNLSLTVNETILSGDNSADNNDAYHVVICAGEMGATTLDGVTITGGKASGTGTSLSVNGQNISNNDGAGLFIRGTNPVLFKNLIIRNNLAANSGGGAVCWSSKVTFENTVIKDNQAKFSGGIHNLTGSTLTLRNVGITGNSATMHGGATYNQSATLNLVNVKMGGNTASQSGGAIYNEAGFANLNNVSIGHNSAVASGGALYLLTTATGRVNLKNSIVWGNNTGVVLDQSASPGYTYSLIQDLTPAGSNIGSDPLFVDLTHHDLHLQPCSPAINSGDPSTFDGIDLDGQSRVQLGRVDMGAYEMSQIANSETAIVSSGNRIATATQLAFGTTWYAADCNNLLLSIQAEGDHPAVGTTHACLWIDNTTPSFVQRRYEITPDINVSGATGKVTLYYTHTDFAIYNQPDKPKLPTGPTDEAGIKNLRIQKRSGSSSDQSGLPTTYPGLPLVIDPDDTDIVWNADESRWEVSFMVEGFSGFFAYAVDNAALPVTLENFSGKEEEGRARLLWQTVSEVNAGHFEVQRSLDAKSFTMIGKVNAIGTISQAERYNFLDPDLCNGIRYYRLRMVDRDGTYAYSTIVSLRLGEWSYWLYPNPVKSGAYLHLESREQASQVKLYDLSGRNIPLAPPSVVNGVIRLKLPEISFGIYLLKIQTIQGILNRKVVVE